MFISVIIPCYNQGIYLNDTINSVYLANKRLNAFLEILIINDGSNDEKTLKILKDVEEGNENIIVIHQENHGLAFTRNRGIEIARGEYIQFLDSDDCLIEDKFYYQIEDFNKNQNLAVSLSNYDFVDINLIKIQESIFHRRLKPSSSILNDLLFKWERGFSIPIHTALFSKKKCFHQNLRFDINLKAKEDWFFWNNIILENLEIVYNDKVLALYRIHDNNMCKDVENMGYWFLNATCKISNKILDEKLRNKFILFSLFHILSFYYLNNRKLIKFFFSKIVQILYFFRS